MNTNNLIFRNVFYITLVIGAHLFPLVTFLSSFIFLVVLFFNKKNRTLKIGLGIFLFIYWPVCFYSYLSLLVQALMTQEILINTYESPVFIKFDVQSFAFWSLRLAAVSVIKLPLLNFKIDPYFTKQFILETYYCVAVICEVLGLNSGLSIGF